MKNNGSQVNKMTKLDVINNSHKAGTQAVPLWTKDFWAISILNLFIFLSFQMFPPALPVYVKWLGASDATVGWLGGMIIIATLIIRPFAGLALDSMGRKKIFIIGLAIVLLMTVAYGLFPIVGMILAIRFVHGLGWGLASTGSTTIAADVIPKQRFGEGMAYFSLSSSLAMAVAPALALYLGMRHTVVVAAVLMVIAIVLAFMIKYRDLPPKPQNSGPRKFAPYEKAAIWPGFIMFLVNSSYGALVSFIAIYALTRGIENIGIFFTVYAVALVVTRPFFGKLIDSKGFGAAVFPGIIAAIIAIVILGFAQNLLWFLVSGFIYGIAFGACQTGLQTMAVLNSPPHRTGAANATFFTGFDGGIGFGSILSGLLATWFTYSQMYLLIAILPTLALLIYLAAKISKKQAKA